jgi:hypothetical protein
MRESALGMEAVIEGAFNLVQAYISDSLIFFREEGEAISRRCLGQKQVG